MENVGGNVGGEDCVSAFRDPLYLGDSRVTVLGQILSDERARARARYVPVLRNAAQRRLPRRPFIDETSNESRRFSVIDRDRSVSFNLLRSVRGNRSRFAIYVVVRLRTFK